MRAASLRRRQYIATSNQECRDQRREDQSRPKCTDLHNGMTPQQEIDANPIVYFDLRGVIDAAQHELCPDTLGH